MERKSFELHLQSAIWIGGIAAAATGGVLLAIVNEGTSPSLVPWLRAIGVLLLIALGGSAYTQLHAVTMISATEKAASATSEDEKKYWNDLSEARRGNTQLSQTSMVYSLLIAALLLILGLIFYQPRTDPKVQWTVASSSTGGGDSIVVMTRPETGGVRILSRRGTGSDWRVDEVEVDGHLATPAPTQPPATTPPVPSPEPPAKK